MKILMRLLSTMSSVMILLLAFGIKAHAQIGSTGYPIVVPTVRWGSEWYVQPENFKKNEYPFEYGLFELDGRVIYLVNSTIPRMSIIDGFFINQDGAPMPYTEETKPIIDAEVHALAIQKKAEIENRYGIRLVFRSSYDDFGNWRFMDSLAQEFESFPEGSVQIIANGSKKTTGKILSFMQRYEANVDEDTRSLYTGIYDDKANRVQTSFSYPECTLHEMGHSMENALNKETQGNLRNIFYTLNGNCDYSKYYYYYDDLSMLEKQPPSFKRSYSATSFSEDFADTFADAVLYSTEEWGVRYSKGLVAPEYLQKVLYIKNLFNQYAKAEILK